MASGEKLKSLGGGRWQSRDGRFTVEQESGTWVVVDRDQTNELGLPLVRGPFKTLSAARDAIEGFRETGPAKSPLAERLADAADAPESRDGANSKPPKAPPKPAPPPEPRWLHAMSDEDRRRFRSLLRRLEEWGIDDAEAIARAEITGDLPALAQRALERRLSAATSVQEAVDIILEGHDRELGARWRLVDDKDREINRLDLDR
jgi:hypothetical protein